MRSIKCKHCGKLFEPKHHNTTICSDLCKRERKTEYYKVYRKKNRSQIKKKTKEYYKKNKTQLNEYYKSYNKENKDSIKKYYSEYIKENAVNKNEYYKKYNKNRRETDILFKTFTNLRTGINSYLKTKSPHKDSHIRKIIGCTPKILRDHCDKSFEKRYGRRHNKKDVIQIDHIVPLSTATTVEEAEKLSHYSNLQYLKAKDNMEKGNKI